jgi:hypothetical protein
MASKRRARFLLTSWPGWESIAASFRWRVRLRS